MSDSTPKFDDIKGYLNQPLNLGTPDCPSEMYWRRQESRLAEGSLPEWTSAERKHISACSWCRKRWAYAESLSPPQATPGFGSRLLSSGWPYVLAASIFIAVFAAWASFWQRTPKGNVEPGQSYVKRENKLISSSGEAGPAVIMAVDPPGVLRDGQTFRTRCEVETDRKYVYLFRFDRQQVTLLGRFPVKNNIVKIEVTGRVDDRPGQEVIVAFFTDEAVEELESLGGYLSAQAFTQLQDQPVKAGTILHEELSSLQPRFWHGRANDIMMVHTFTHLPLP